MDKDLLKNLKIQSFESDVTQTELIQRYIYEGLIRDKNRNMEEFKLNTIIVNDGIMEKLLIKSDSLNVDTNELANNYIYLLDHDKPEGDDIFDKISGIIDVESKLNAVELKKASQIRGI